MGFDQEKKDKLRESMDYGSNRRLTAVANKAATIDAPILIIGLGGTGADAAIKVKKMVYDRIQCEKKENGEVMDKPKNIEYLILDTDAANKKISEGGIRFSDAMDESLIYTSGDIQAKLQSSSLPDYITSWINKEIDVKEVINGAGAVRQLGRFMLFDNIQQVTGVLESKIRRVTANYENTVPLYVFILSGICGGTGSGTFLDIPYMVRGVANRIDSLRVVQRVGLLFLPDVNLNVPGVNDTKKESLKRNGFAALKELDYLMNVNNTGDCFEQEYGRLHIGADASGDVPPYETCILMSSKDADGRTQENPYSYTLTVAAETVLGFIAAEKNKNVQDFSINSFLSNNANESATFLGLLGDNIRPVHYSYAVAGGSSAVLPMDDIMSYMAYLAFKEVDGQWNRIPEPDEVKEVLSAFGLDRLGLEQELCRQAPQPKALQRHTYEMIKQSPQLLISDFQDNLEQKKKYIRDKDREMLEDMTARVQAENNLINEIFRDVKRGPVFAQRLLFTSSDDCCVEKEINEMRRYFITKAPSPQMIDSLERQATLKMNELIGSKAIMPGTKKKLRDELVKAQKDYYDALFQQASCETLAQQCDKYFEIFRVKNNEIYSCIAEMLNTLVELFRKFGAISTEANESKNGNVTTLSWSIVDVPKFIQELEKRMKNDSDLSVDMEAFVKNFYSYLYDNADIWNGARKADLVENLNHFISEQFERVLSKSMDFYIRFIANSLGTTVTEYSQKICDDLLKRSNIKFPVCATYNPPMDNPSYSYVSVPIDSGDIGREIRSRVRNHIILKDSEIKDRLFMLNFKIAMPLYAYSSLADCHKSYASLEGEKPGLHLCEGTRKNWWSLPSPLPQSEWEGGHFVENEARANQAWAELFDKAVKYRFIRLEEENGSQYYNCYWGDLIDPERILKKNGLDLQGDMDVSVVLACLGEISERLEDSGRLKNQKRLFRKRYKTSEDGTRALDEKFARDIFIKMVMVRGQIKQMVEDYEKCMEIQEKLKPFRNRKKLLRSYVKLIYTETLTKRRGEYIYIDKSDVTQVFCKLKDEQNDYPEYYLFNYFFSWSKGEDEKRLDEVVKVSEKLETEKSRTDEGYEALKKKLKDYVEELKSVINTLNSEWREVEDGQAILTTYKELYKEADAQHKGM